MTIKSFKNENQITKQYLISELSKERLVVFCGSGCSTDVGLPTWDALINSIVKEYNIQTNEKNLLRLANRIERSIGKTHFREKICELLVPENTNSTPIMNSLSKSSINLFITTNFDHVIENSFSKNDINLKILTNPLELPHIEPKSKTLVKIHGDINSPSSLIITEKDYTYYNQNHKPFIEWLDIISSQNTVLFVGTSFEDPRLREIDDKVLGKFSDFRRPPCIILKKPNTDNATDLEDFYDLCEDYKERNFKLIIVDTYDEIPELIQDIVVEGETDSNSYTSPYSLADKSHSDIELKNLLDEKAQSLIERIYSNGIFASRVKVEKELSVLIEYYNQKKAALSPEVRVEFIILISTSYLIINNIKLSNQYLNELSDYIVENELVDLYNSKVVRLRAKILSVQQQSSKALEILKDLNDDATLNLKLSILLDSNELNNKEDYFRDLPLTDETVASIIKHHILSDNSIEAKKLFSDFVNEKKLTQGIKSKVFNSRTIQLVFFNYITSLYDKLISLSSLQIDDRFIPDPTNNKQQFFLKEACNALNIIFKEYYSWTEIISSTYIYDLKRIELIIRVSLNEMDKARKIAEELYNEKPITRGIADYYFNYRTDNLNFYKELRTRLSTEHKDKEFWVFHQIANIDIQIFNDFKSAWSELVEAIPTCKSLNDRIIIADLLQHVGFEVSEVNSASTYLENLLSDNENTLSFFKSRYEFLHGELSNSFNIFNEVNPQQLPNILLPQYYLLKGELDYTRKEVDSAIQNFKRSYDLGNSIYGLQKLISCYTIKNDNNNVFKYIQRLEGHIKLDQQTLKIKAISAENVLKLDIAMMTWEKLYNQDKDNSYFAFNFARLLLHHEKNKKALEVLGKFIEPGPDVDLLCIGLAVEIHTLGVHFNDAFNLLHKNKEYFQDDPNLLMKYMDICYKVDKDEEAHQVHQRLLLLKNEGKVPDEMLRVVSLNEITDMIKDQKEYLDNINSLYQQGRIPRVLLVWDKNQPLLLDWKYRTSEIEFNSNAPRAIEYSTYISNLYKIINVDNTKFLSRRKFPKKCKEIIIDYHALISLSQLKLLDRVTLAFDKIYYSKTIIQLMKLEHGKFHHYQQSEIRSIKTIVKLVTSKKLLVLDCEDSSENRIVELSQKHNAPIISSFKNDFNKVIRISQLLDYFYTIGKITDLELDLFKNVKEDPPIMNHDESIEELKKCKNIIFDEIAIKSIIKTNLIEKIMQNQIEFAIDSSLYSAYLNSFTLLEDYKRFSKEHENLSDFIQNNSKFVEYTSNTEIKKNYDIVSDNYIAPIKLQESSKIPLVTDDRTIQSATLTSPDDFAAFSSAELLDYLHLRGYTDISEYAISILSLCKWRCFFILPNVDVLYFFIKKHKAGSLGSNIRQFITYAHHSLRNQGLISTYDPNTPTLSPGLKLWTDWIHLWTDLIFRIWSENDFTIKEKESVIHKLLLQSIPEAPSYIAVVQNQGLNSEDILIARLLQNVSSSKHFEIYHNLFTRFKDTLNLSESFLFKSLNNFLNIIIDANLKIAIRRSFVARVMFLFTDLKTQKFLIPETTSNLLSELGLNDNNLFTEMDEQPTNIEQQNEVFLNALDNKSKLPEAKSTPLIHSSSKKKKIVFFLEKKVLDNDIRVRTASFAHILESDQVTSFTKSQIEKLKDQVESSNYGIWYNSAKKVQDFLNKDFHYKKAEFESIAKLNTNNLNNEFNEIFFSLLEPSIYSVLESMPSYLQDLTSTRKITNEIVKSCKQNLDTSSSIVDILSELSNYFHIPFSPKVSLVNIFEKLVQYFNIDTSNFISTSNDIISWANDSDDPVRLLISSTLLIYARQFSKQEDHAIDEEINKFITNIFNIDYSDAKDIRSTYKSSIDLTNSLWIFKVRLFKYYHHYFKINYAEEANLDHNILMSWWLSNEVSSAITNAYAHLPQANLLDTINIFSFDILQPEINHLLYNNANKVSSAIDYAEDYTSITINNHLSANLLNNLNSIYKSKKLFNGTLVPEPLINSYNSERLFVILAEYSLHGISQLHYNKSISFSTYTESPLLSTLRVIQYFFSDSLEFLGDEKNTLIKLITTSCKKNFLTKIEEKIQDAINQRELFKTSLYLSCLRARYETDADFGLPDNLFHHLSLNKLGEIDHPYSYLSIGIVIKILEKSLIKNSYQFSDLLNTILNNLNFENWIKGNTKLFIESLLFVEIASGNHQSIHVFCRNKNEVVINILRDFKSYLESISKQIPNHLKANARWIINKLDDI